MENLLIPERRKRRNASRHDPKGQQQRPGEKEEKEQRNLLHIPWPQCARQVRKKSEDRKRRKAHHCVPKFQARQADPLQNGEKRRLLRDVLERYAIEKAEKHDRWNVIPGQRSERIARNENLQQVWAVLSGAIGNPTRGKGLGNSKREHDQQPEGDHPERNIESPAGKKELPGLCRRHASQPMQKRAYQIGINRHFQKHDIDLPDRPKEMCVIANQDTQQNAG